MKFYLQSAKQHALYPNRLANEVHIYMFGAQNGSIDSVVSALAMGYIFNDKSEVELRAEFPMLVGVNGRFPRTHIIPVIGLKKDHWLAKKEVIDYLDEHAINTEDCLFA